MSYEATGSGTITLNVASATEQRNLQMALLTWYDNCCAARIEPVRRLYEVSDRTGVSSEQAEDAAIQ